MFEKGILICKLAKVQKIDIQCQAIKGVGREHSKWSAVSNVCFSSIPSIKIGNLNQDLQKTISNNCPKKVFSIQENTLKVSNEKDCSFCNECVEKSKNEIIVTPSDKNFIMEIENNGSISSLDILKCSLKIWKDQLITLQNEINKL